MFKILRIKQKGQAIKMKTNRQSGQSLLEVVIVIAVGVIVISALVFATISGLRNAQFAKNQAVATKYAQEGIESVKRIRDRDEADSLQLSYTDSSNNLVTTSRFSDLWSSDLTGECSTHPCNLNFSVPSGLNALIGPTETSEELEDGAFKRQVQIKDGENSDIEKIVTVVVKWKDFSGDHESRLTTILRKL